MLTKFHKENENFKKTLSTKEKSSLKKFKKIKSNIKKSKSEITKLRKKVKDKSSSMPCIVSEERKSSNVLEQQLEKTTRQLYADYKVNPRMYVEKGHRLVYLIIFLLVHR